MLFISVDCGTTNLRCRLCDSDGMRILRETKRTAGGRDTALTGSNARLREALVDAVSEIVGTASDKRADIAAVICSGTITSAVGVYHVHHLPAPAGAADSAKAAEFVEFRELPGIPFFFIPGIKTVPNASSLAGKDELTRIDMSDSMSGEECETYGILELTGISGDAVVCLPGSYTKVFYVSADGRISSMRSGMAGELTAAVSGHTLMRCTLPDPVIRRIIQEKLICGYDYAESRGVSPALAKSRILRVNDGWDDDETGNFFAGAAMSSDIRSVLLELRDGSPLIIGGTNPLRDAYEILVRHAAGKRVDILKISDAEARSAVPCGQWKVFSLRNGSRILDLSSIKRI